MCVKYPEGKYAKLIAKVQQSKIPLRRSAVWGIEQDVIGNWERCTLRRNNTRRINHYCLDMC